MLDRLVHGHCTPLHVEQLSICTLPWVTLGPGLPCQPCSAICLLQFTYRVTECGIRAKAISQDMVLYSLEIYYTQAYSSGMWFQCHVLPRHVPHGSPTSCSRNLAPKRRGHNPEWRDMLWSVHLSQSSQRPNCYCLSCVYNERGQRHL